MMRWVVLSNNKGEMGIFPIYQITISAQIPSNCHPLHCLNDSLSIDLIVVGLLDFG